MNPIDSTSPPQSGSSNTPKSAYPTGAPAAPKPPSNGADASSRSNEASPANSVWDVIVLGAGAAGLFCAAQAGQAGLRVLLIDHGKKLAEKIRISGGGRSNFTNKWLDARAPQKHYLSDNPHFCRSALSRYTPQNFIDLVHAHGIGFHEKHKGQLFCDESANDLIAMLNTLCQRGQVQRWQPCAIESVAFLHGENGAGMPPHKNLDQYAVYTERGTAYAPQLVVATGGLSIPKIGATGIGYRIAEQFGVPLIAQRPGLVPLTFDAQQWAPFKAIAGVALPVRIRCGQGKAAASFDEDLLFTHRGLSGPAILQISNYWHAGESLEVNLLPEMDLAEALLECKKQSRKLLLNELTQWLPNRLAQLWVEQDAQWQLPIDQVPHKSLLKLADSLQRWRITPTGTEGYAKAEVTLGGVDTRTISSQTMQSQTQAGLYFIGEVLDVTGWLGGYNFQWAWASAFACAGHLQSSFKLAQASTSTQR